jgi:flagellar motor protein MotB
MSARRPEEEVEEGYFASISDLMVGILLIFLLMLTVFALNFADEDKDAVIIQLTAERDAARVEVRRLTDELDREHLQRQRLVEELNRERVEVRRLTDELERESVERRRLADAISQLQARLVELLQRDAARQAELGVVLARLATIEEDISSQSRRVQLLREQLLTQIQANLRARNIQVEISQQQDVLRLPSEEIFQSGTANFTSQGRQRMIVLLDELSRLLPCYALGSSPPPGCATVTPIFETVLFEGHTDTVPYGGDPLGNWRLSTDRARAMIDLMQGPLAPLAELRNASGQNMLGLAGYGESRTLQGLAGVDPKNRRIEIRFLLAASREAEIVELRESLDQLRTRLEALRVP